MKIRTVEEMKSAGSQPATPRATDTVDPATIAATTAGKQARAPKLKPGSSASGYLAGNDEDEERGEPKEPEPGCDAPKGPPDLDPGEFPLGALSPTMRAMVQDVSDVYQVPLQLPAMCGVAIVSGALGNSYTLTGAVNGKTSYGNLYVIPAAPKSSGKGSVADALMPPFLQASVELDTAFKERELPGLKTDKAILEKRITVLVNELATNKTGTGSERRAMGEPERLETKRELDEAHARLEAIEPLLKAMPTYWISNAKSEAMGRQFSRNNLELFCYSPEGGETVRVLMGKYRGDWKADFDLALSGYSVESLRTDRIGRGTCDILPCLSMLLLVQPVILRELIGDEEAFERGMTARCLPFIVETEPKKTTASFGKLENSQRHHGANSFVASSRVASSLPAKSTTSFAGPRRGKYSANSTTRACNSGKESSGTSKPSLADGARTPSVLPSGYAWLTTSKPQNSRTIKPGERSK